MSEEKTSHKVALKKGVTLDECRMRKDGRTDFLTEVTVDAEVCNTRNDQVAEKSPPRPEFSGGERRVGHEPRKVNGNIQGITGQEDCSLTL